MTVQELLIRKLNDYDESMLGASHACGFAGNGIERIISGHYKGITQRMRRALYRHFDLAPHVLDAAIDEGRCKKIW